MLSFTMPIRAEKTSAFSVIGANGETAVVNLYIAQQSFGYQTDFQEVPVYYVRVTVNDRTILNRRTRSAKTWKAWQENLNGLPRA